MWNKYRTRWSSGISKWEYVYEGKTNKKEFIKNLGGKNNWLEEYATYLEEKYNIKNDGEHYRGMDIKLDVKPPEDDVLDEIQETKNLIKYYQRKLKILLGKT